jgi:excisionase family DNA binding protein
VSVRDVSQADCVADRRAVLTEIVDRALGPFAHQATMTVSEVGEVLGLGRSSAYEAVRCGVVPSIRVGNRIVVPVPAIAGLLLGVDPTPSHAEGANVVTLDRRRTDVSA